MNTPWSQSDIKFLKDNYLKYNNNELALHLDRTVNSVVCKLNGLKLHRPKICDSINFDFLNTWSHDLSYILGFIMADGHVNKYKLTVSLHKKDIEILIFIKEKLCPKARIRERNQADSRTGIISYQYSLEISSKKLCDKLHSLGIPQYKTGHELFLDIPPDYISDFIRGYFDGDGHISYYKYNNNKEALRFDISCANKNFLLSINKYFDNKCHIKFSGNCYHLTSSSRPVIKNIKNILYNGHFCLKRKWDKFNEYNFDYTSSYFLSNDDIRYIVSQKGKLSSRQVAKNLNISKYPVLKIWNNKE